MSDWDRISKNDIHMILKHSIDFNTAVIAIVGQVLSMDGYVKPKAVTKEIKRLHKIYNDRIDTIIKPYDNNRNTN